MYALVSHSDVRPAVGGSVTVASAKKVDQQLDKEAAFVVTDIESSTELSNQDPEAFKQVRPASGLSVCVSVCLSISNFICPGGTCNNLEQVPGCGMPKVAVHGWSAMRGCTLSCCPLHIDLMHMPSGPLLAVCVKLYCHCSCKRCMTS